jgi:hypothetical protein
MEHRQGNIREPKRQVSDHLEGGTVTCLRLLKTTISKRSHTLKSEKKRVRAWGECESFNNGKTNLIKI